MNRSTAVFAFLVSATLMVGLALVDKSIAQNADDDFSKHGLGLILSPKEVTDKIPAAPTYRALVPDHFDLSDKMPLPDAEGQGQVGSCTAWAVAVSALMVG